MNHPLQEATEFLQKELNDPLYKAEYDDENKTFDVLRWRGNIDGTTGYYALQKSYDHPIDSRVVEDFKAHDLRGKELKLVFAEMERQKDRARKDSLKKVGLYAGDMARDLHRFVIHPRIISIPNLRK